MEAALLHCRGGRGGGDEQGPFKAGARWGDGSKAAPAAALLQRSGAQRAL